MDVVMEMLIIEGEKWIFVKGETGSMLKASWESNVATGLPAVSFFNCQKAKIYDCFLQ